MVRGWGIASMLRDVGHLVSLTEFEDKLANAISTKYASRDLSPTSKRNAGCASAGLCVCVVSECAPRRLTFFLRARPFRFRRPPFSSQSKRTTSSTWRLLKAIHGGAGARSVRVEEGASGCFTG
jgi:hypothetical protein